MNGKTRVKRLLGGFSTIMAAVVLTALVVPTHAQATTAVYKPATAATFAAGSGGKPAVTGCTTVIATVAPTRNFWPTSRVTYKFNLKASWCVNHGNITVYTRRAWFSDNAGVSSVKWAKDQWTPPPGRPVRSRLTVKANGVINQWCFAPVTVCPSMGWASITFTMNGNLTWSWKGIANG